MGKAWCPPRRQEHATHEPVISRAMLADVPLTGLSFTLHVFAHSYFCRLVTPRPFTYENYVHGWSYYDQTGNIYQGRTNEFAGQQPDSLSYIPADTKIESNNS